MTTRCPVTTRRRLLFILAALTVAAIGVAIAYNQPIFRAYPKRFALVDNRVLYRSAQPTARQIANLVEDYGIRTLLIVREGGSERVREEIEYAGSHGLNVTHIPVESRKPISDEQIREFFRCVDDPANRPVLIHCSAGRHRTGYLCALYRLERQGWTLDRAINEMLSFKFDVEGQALVLDQLRHYTPARKGPSTGNTTVNSTGPADPNEERGAVTPP